MNAYDYPKARKYGTVVVIFYLLLIVLSACSAPNRAGDDAMELRGEITQVHPLAPAQRDGAVIGALDIAGLQEEGQTFPDASVTITEDTRFFRQVDQTRQPATLDDVAAGQRVQVLLVGSAQETYPVRGTADEVVILGE